jgi:hypothetical protein
LYFVTLHIRKTEGHNHECGECAPATLAHKSNVADTSFRQTDVAIKLTLVLLFVCSCTRVGFVCGVACVLLYTCGFCLCDANWTWVSFVLTTSPRFYRAAWRGHSPHNVQRGGLEDEQVQGRGDGPRRSVPSTDTFLWLCFRFYFRFCLLWTIIKCALFPELFQTILFEFDSFPPSSQLQDTWVKADPSVGA